MEEKKENSGVDSKNIESQSKSAWTKVTEFLSQDISPIPKEEQEAFNADFEKGLGDAFGKAYWPLRRAANYFGYKNSIKFLILLFEMPFVLFTCWTIYSVFTSGAYACVHFQPLVATAQDCLDMNNASDEHPDTVYIPQMDCRAIYQDGLPRYNVSDWEALNFTLPAGVPAFKVEVNNSG